MFIVYILLRTTTDVSKTCQSLLKIKIYWKFSIEYLEKSWNSSKSNRYGVVPKEILHEIKLK